MSDRTPPLRRKPSSIDIIDTLSIFNALGTLKDEREKLIVFNYRELLAVLRQARSDLGLRTAEATLAAVALDPDSEPQRRFVDAIAKMGIMVEEIDYRNCYVTVPGGLGERHERPVSSLAPPLSYLLGLVAERERPEITLVSGSFDLYGPLYDFATTRSGRAVLCFFKSFLDKRWIQYGGLLAPNSPIRFVDLDDHSRALVGLDLSGSVASAQSRSGGLASM